MKKYILGAIAISVLLPALVFAQTQGDVNPNPTSNCVSITHNLQYRQRDAGTGGDVSTLQDFLQSQGYLNSEPTGYFGLLTQAAAKAFQSASGILNSGYVGPITRGKINTVSCGGSTTNPVTTNPTTPTNCSNGALFDPMTGVKCNYVTPLPPPINTTKPSIVVTSPNGGEQWQVGQTNRISWSSSGLSPTDMVNISLSIPSTDGTLGTWGKGMVSNI